MVLWCAKCIAPLFESVFLHEKLHEKSRKIMKNKENDQNSTKIWKNKLVL
jgi:hypothetical protein